MAILSNVLIVTVALLEIYFMILEMFLWEKPKGMKVFGLSSDFAKQSASLAKNQGLYNGFLAAGLLYGVMARDSQVSYQFKSFFLLCVFVAGVYGAMTANRKIIWVQALPALLALGCLWVASN